MVILNCKHELSVDYIQPQIKFGQSASNLHVKLLNNYGDATFKVHRSPLQIGLV